MVPRQTARQSLKPLSIFVPHGATKLTDHDNHGDGLVQWALIRELARRDHRITVVAPSVSIVGNVPENVEIHELSGFAAFGLAGYLLRAYAAYRRLRRTHRFDLVHQMNPVLRGATLPWAFSRRPVVLGTYVGDWAYEVPLHRMRTAGLAEWTRMAAKIVLDALQQRFAKALIVATPFARNRIPFASSVRGRIREIPHGVDTDCYTPAPAADDPAVRPDSVLFVGQVAPHKGLAVIIDAFDLVARRMPHAKLVLVGPGGMNEIARRRAERGGWRGQLEIVGPVANDRVPGWLRACSLLVSAALGEPYGQTVVEALATARPVIVNDSGGVRHLVAGTQNPVVPFGDAPALAEAIVSLLNDPARARTIGENNRRLAVERFAWPRVVDELEKAYAAVLEFNP